MLRPLARRGVQVALVAVTFVLVSAAIAEIPLRSAIDAAASGNLKGANSDFDVARALRPWDAAIPATAAHAYVVLAQDGIASAVPYARPWVATELSEYPHSVQVLSDAGNLALARHEPVEALRSFRAARKLDPLNPTLRAGIRAAAQMARHH
jgi:hypothetical protein